MSKPVDRFGEPIKKGMLMHWGKTDLVVKVQDVYEGGKVGGVKEPIPGFVDVMIRLPFGHQEGQEFACYKDFILLAKRDEGEYSDQERTDKILDRNKPKENKEAAHGTGPEPIRR